MDSAWPIDRRSRPGRPPLRLLLGTPPERSTDTLLARIDELEARLAATETQPTGYVLFVASPTGYSIVECDEDPPPLDQLLLLADGAHRVAFVRCSPFPGDRRPCFVVERVP
jgi:hypothetical protein